ncbi:MAG: dicarboxylate/amino acid:cation symporter [Opitutales bacterium]
MKKLALHWQILIALALAFAVGLWANFETEGMENKPDWFGELKYGADFVGKMFLNALKMMVVPLVTTSIIVGIINVGGERNFGRLGAKTLGFYAATGLLAVLTGLLLVNFIQPGEVPPELQETMRQQGAQADLEQIEKAQEKAAEGFRGILEIFQRMIPANLFDAAVKGQLLGLIFFSLLFGFFVAKLSDKHRETQTRFWESLNATLLAMTKFIIAFAPIGVLGLVIPTLMTTGTELFEVMGKFALTVLLGLGIHLFVVLPLFIKLVAKENPLNHYRAMAPALLTAFSTASSSATLPLTMDCVRKRAGVSSKVTSFTLPLGATVNMDGTALFECVVVVFLAQLFGVEMGFVTQFSVVVMALLTSIGVAGIPHASLVAIIVILNAAGFTPEQITIGVGIVYVVDRLLDMCRTTVNVFGDSCAAVVIGKTEGESGYYATLQEDSDGESDR